jgi:hypothetical protein
VRLAGVKVVSLAGKIRAINPPAKKQQEKKKRRINGLYLE